MRIAAISDVHGNLPALQAVLADIRRRGCDLTVDLGDIVSGPLWPEATLDLRMATPMLGIRGNHERQMLADDLEAMGDSDRRARQALRPDQLAWLAALPPTARIDGGVLLTHGSPAGDRDHLLQRIGPEGARPATRAEVEASLAGIDAQVVLCGHSHVPQVLRLDDGRLCVNPGSVGLPAWRGHLPYPHVMQSGTPAARYAILHRDIGAWHADLIAVHYDPAEAAGLAQERGCDDWAVALRTGCLH